MTVLTRFQVALLALGGALGITFLTAAQVHDHGEHEPSPPAHEHDAGADAAQERAAEEDREVLYWYDPMHPEHRFDRPGPSPFMDMDLVPRYADEVPAGEVRVPAGVQQMMNLRVAAAQLAALPRRIDTVGWVAYDESRIHHLHPRVSGWIEQVNVHAVGESIEIGQVLYTLYSPELVNAQEDYLQALERGVEVAQRAARDRLTALGVQPEVIAMLEEDAAARHALPWIAREDGVVTELNIRHGMFVEPGDPLLALVNLASVWVIAEVFDRHSGWLAPGLAAEVTTPYRDEERSFPTRVDQIYPQLDATTRTVRVRLPIEQTNEHVLKPGMWTSVRIFAEPGEPRVLIPREALIRTGHSARVVVRLDGERFAVREVQPGAEAGDHVEILSGLAPEEQVVVSGQFLLDSEAALGPALRRLEGHEHQH